MWDKVRKNFFKACEWLEIVMAIVVLIGLIIATIALWPELVHFWENRAQQGAFLEFLDAVLAVVIGIEFMKMLCRPNSQNIIEALIFLIARHMIVQTMTPVEDLLAVISIGILFFFRRFMLATKPDKNQNVPSILGAIKNAQTQGAHEPVSRVEEEIQQEQEKKEADR